jgi:hypothetical protein
MANKMTQGKFNTIPYANVVCKSFDSNIFI